jgi:hypothetical protein
MIIENMTSQMLYVVSLSLTSTEKWKAAGSFTSGSKVEGLFTVLAMIALITAIVLLFWMFSKYRCGALRISVFARFSKDEVTAGVPENGLAEFMVIGRFTDGQYFYGFDNVWICSWSW